MSQLAQQMILMGFVVFTLGFGVALFFNGVEFFRATLSGYVLFAALGAAAVSLAFPVAFNSSGDSAAAHPGIAK